MDIKASKMNGILGSLNTQIRKTKHKEKLPFFKQIFEKKIVIQIL